MHLKIAMNIIKMAIRIFKRTWISEGLLYDLLIKSDSPDNAFLFIYLNMHR